MVDLEIDIYQIWIYSRRQKYHLHISYDFYTKIQRLIIKLCLIP